jgi:hypothetical protein
MFRGDEWQVWGRTFPFRSEGGKVWIGAMRHLAHNAPGAWPRSISRVGRIALADRDNLHEEVRFPADSPLEGAGFEPSVPRRRARRLRGLGSRSLRRISIGRNHAQAGLEILVVSRGTDGSNPGPSSGESMHFAIRSA